MNLRNKDLIEEVNLSKKSLPQPNPLFEEYKQKLERLLRENDLLGRGEEIHFDISSQTFQWELQVNFHTYSVFTHKVSLSPQLDVAHEIKRIRESVCKTKKVMEGATQVKKLNAKEYLTQVKGVNSEDFVSKQTWFGMKE
jgi:hypothetical protein